MRLHPSEHSEFPLVSVLHPFPTHPTEEPGFGFDFDSSLARFRSDVLASRGSREPFTETPIVSCGQTSGARGASDIFRSYLGVGTAERR